MLLSKHQRLLQRKVDSFCFGASLAGVIAVIARPMLMGGPDIQSEDAEQDATKMLLSTMAGIKGRRRRMTWKKPSGFSYANVSCKYHLLYVQLA